MSEKNEIAPYSFMPEAFSAVAMLRDSRIPDGKALTDAEFRPGTDPVVLLQLFNKALGQDGADLVGLWLEHTATPDYRVQYPGRVALLGVTPEEALSRHISARWTDLSYHQPTTQGSKVGTKFPHLRAGIGARFASEGYGWDTELGVEGLLVEAETSPCKDWLVKRAVWTVRNIAGIIDEQGFNPNGLRDYLRTRPQLPTYSRMVDSLANYFDRHPDELELHFGNRGADVIEEFLPQVVKEYEWWMQPPRAVRMEDGLVLNIPSDSADGPRPESYWEDVTEFGLAQQARDVDEGGFYMNKRIATATGRDFSGRWCLDPNRPETVRASVRPPVELQAELLRVEKFIGHKYRVSGRSVKAAEFDDLIKRRITTINKYCWDSRDGCYYDPDLETGRLVRYGNIATAYPVTAGAADSSQAENVACYVRDNLLAVGGFVTSRYLTGQQWDYPNIFPVDQREGQRLFLATGHDSWAKAAESMWLDRELGIFSHLGVVAEKHDSVSAEPRIGGGGEYAPQPDLLWTLALARVALHRRGVPATGSITVPPHELSIESQDIHQ